MMKDLMLLEYEDLEWKDNSFSDSSMEKLNSMLMIKKDGNIIYICYPNHVFDKMEVDCTTKEIKAVDFGSVNIEKMRSINDFGRFSIVEQLCSKSNNQFTYILKKASHMIKKYKQEGKDEFSYPFLILEEIKKEDEDPQYFARGIISCNQKGFSIAFNKEAIKTMNTDSVWQKGLRFGDNYTNL